MSTDPQRHARSFGGVADAYDRGRPSYPDAAVAWLVGERPVTVLELGAGTGKLTERLVAAGHDVHATEPDEAMLAILRRRLPDVRTSATGAEEIPVADQSVDVVVAAQCFHWFDPEVALPEIARVLRPGGHLAAVWNQRDERIPWVRKLGRVIGTQDNLTDPLVAVETSTDFHEVDDAAFKHWQVVDRRSIQDLVRSRSNVAVLGEAERERVMAELLALYDDYGRGMDGMQLPYQARCFRARVAERAVPVPEPRLEPTVPIALAGDDPMVDSADTIPRVAAGFEDTGTLLIDFR
ncbi:class I SAM-dependent methyltransferase [Nocardioides sp.]|uniref:class I SAM-dependent methyltransferase n=1 Tax=Nocardioides sp. TaxID=35761 RepID=UPI002726E617|nr:class I SAM-dependent methyltransferase [Nocardioides sp.]MDO9455602.1 methyltransferase domain-containing protein [Nocardioides sp.]